MPYITEDNLIDTFQYKLDYMNLFSYFWDNN